MRLAFFADLHANREAFEACLRRLGKVGYDRAVILGDIVGYGADASWTVDTVQRMVDDGAVCVLGNHDEAAVRGATEHMNAKAREAIEWTHRQLDAAQLAFLENLPLAVTDDDRLYVHANAWNPGHWGYVDDARMAARSLAATPQRITFCGHVHEPAVYHARPGMDAGAFVPRGDFPIPLAASQRWLAIPGSVGQPRDGNPAACCAWLDTDRGTLTCLRVPYDHHAASARILAAGLPPSFAARLAEGT